MAKTVRIPILAILGRRESGKTMMVEALTKSLATKCFRVACAKHISQKGFSMDIEGKDTWRYSAAGAEVVIAVSDRETTIKIKNTFGIPSLKTMSKFAIEMGADALLLEGFSELVLSDRHIGKIICVRGLEEYAEFKKKIQGQIIAFCSVGELEKNIINLERGLQNVIQKALDFIVKMKKVYEILNQLAGLDCGKCGRETCQDLSLAIYEGQARIEDCQPLRLKPELETMITVEGVEIPIQPFVSEFVKKTVLGMVSALKGVQLEGDEKVKIEIIRRKPKE